MFAVYKDFQIIVSRNRVDAIWNFEVEVGITIPALTGDELIHGALLIEPTQDYMGA